MSLPADQPSLNNRGMSLIELMVSIGILSIVTFGVITMIVAQTKEVRALQENLAKLDLEPAVIRALSAGGICSYVLKDPTQSSTATTPNRSQDAIDTTDATTLAASSVSIQNLPSSVSVSGNSVARVGANASANSNSVKILSMKFINFRANGVDQYLADFEIAFDPALTVRSLRPIVIKNIGISTKATDPVNAKSFEDCTSPRGPAPQLHRYTFTTTQAWAVPSGVTSAFVSMAGGGGSGMGWRISNAIKSGDSGGYVTAYPINLVPGETIAITVGKGGKSYAPTKTSTLATPGVPYYVYISPSGDDGLGGYPGTSSSIVSPTLGLILECAGGSGGVTGGIDAFDNREVPGDGATGLPGARYGGGNPPISAPSRPAAGPYAQPNGPGKCGTGGAPFGVGSRGQQFWGASSILNSGFWPGGGTPFGEGSGGDIQVSGCYINTTTTGTCVSPQPGLDGIVHIDVLY
ncbi:MAG: prepilin-type N-terminal cleavage/methylation domain-containing protein [Bdellovibrionaceae bacterium]|nr:prepilin-type N-terminal cleavage/methylation domain-containing protein [Pseudobdellovibrionaceae bacterium]